MLERAGFETITMEQYVRFLDGDTEDLPQRPILITFDDGRLDSYRGADRILAKHKFSAVMFVIAGNVSEGHEFYLDWTELKRMQESGRWNIQEHAGTMHENVPIDANGNEGPAYANRRWVKGSGLESFGDWRRRVTQDVIWAKETMAAHIPDFVPWSFAVPFGSYNYGLSNDPRAPKYFQRLLTRNFKAVFLNNPPSYTKTTSPPNHLGRMELNHRVETNRLYRWLAERRPVQGG